MSDSESLKSTTNRLALDDDEELEYYNSILNSQDNSNASESHDQLMRNVSRGIASSIIGGSSIADDTDTIKDKQGSLVQKEEIVSNDLKNDNNQQNDKRQSLINIKNLNYWSKLQSSVSNDELSTISKKIFPFSLPFGDSLTIKKFHIFNNSDHEDSIKFLTTQNYDSKELKQKLKRKDSLSTLEEAFLYKDLKGSDNSRLRAVRKSLTPNIAINTMNFINEKITNNTLGSKEKDDDYYLNTVFERLSGNVVILGGYRGSVLRERQSGRKVWIPIKVGLNLRKVDLVVGPKDEDELNMEDYIYPDGMLTNVGPIDISKKLIKKLRSNPNVNVHIFSYDWRLSPRLSSEKLTNFLKSLKGKSIVLGHSMGGIIAHHSMNTHPELYNGLLYIGTPTECLNVLGPIRFGDSVLLSKNILTDEANFMMRSSFVFLPHHGKVFFNKQTKEFVQLDLFDPKVWHDYNLSPLVSSIRKSHPELFNYRITYDESYEYLRRVLKSTKEFLSELTFNPKINYPPLSVVYGDSVPSVRGVFVNDGQDIKDGKYDDFFYGPGDGVIHEKWIMPLPGFTVESKVRSDCGHVSLMTDFLAIGKAFDGILQKLEN